MLEKLEISRFKTVRDLKLEFGRVNLFIGGNGAGKSNLLEAIGLASACLGRGLGDSDIAGKGLRVTPSELMKSSFKNEDLPKTLELHASFANAVDYKVTLSSKENDPLLRFFSESSTYGSQKVFGRSNRGARATGVTHADRLDRNRGIWDQIKATYDIPDAVDREFSEFSRYVIYTPQTDFLRGKQKGAVDSPPIGLHGEGLPEAVSSFLDEWRRLERRNRRNKEAVDLEWRIIDACVKLVWLPGWANTFGVHHARTILTSRDIADRTSEIVYFRDRFMHARRNRLSVYDSSEGTLFLLFAAIILAHPDAPRVFALDNVDNALNPRLTRRLVEQIINVTLSSAGDETEIGARQVFLTSHNPTSLDAFDIFDSRQRVFVVQRNERGHTVADQLKPSPNMTREEWETAKGGRNLSQVWLDGDIPGALGDL
ncbi:MAG: AAA family ATPase [Maritimibacter sp.]|nr:AAA family ATPase [Maritimibacter sp.]